MLLAEKVFLQLANGPELAEMKRRAGLLKRVCRQRTQGAWKEWRSSMEAQRAEWLSAHLNLLQQDQGCLQQGQQGVQEVQLQAQELGAALRAERDALRAKRQVRLPLVHHCACVGYTIFGAPVIAAVGLV